MDFVSPWLWVRFLLVALSHLVIFSSIEPVVKLPLIHQAVAQQVERHPDTVKVVGSSPACLTTKLVISSFKVKIVLPHRSP